MAITHHQYTKVLTPTFVTNNACIFDYINKFSRSARFIRIFKLLASKMYSITACRGRPF